MKVSISIGRKSENKEKLNKSQRSGIRTLRASVSNVEDDQKVDDQARCLFSADSISRAT